MLSNVVAYEKKIKDAKSSILKQKNYQHLSTKESVAMPALPSTHRDQKEPQQIVTLLQTPLI